MTLDCFCLSWKERSREGQEIIFKDLSVFHLGIRFLVDIFRFQLEHSAEYKTIRRYSCCSLHIPDDSPYKTGGSGKL